MVFLRVNPAANSLIPAGAITRSADRSRWRVRDGPWCLPGTRAGGRSPGLFIQLNFALAPDPPHPSRTAGIFLHGCSAFCQACAVAEESLCSAVLFPEHSGTLPQGQEDV